MPHPVHRISDVMIKWFSWICRFNFWIDQAFFGIIIGAAR